MEESAPTAGSSLIHAKSRAADNSGAVSKRGRILPKYGVTTAAGLETEGGPKNPVFSVICVVESGICRLHSVFCTLLKWFPSLSVQQVCSTRSEYGTVASLHLNPSVCCKHCPSPRGAAGSSRSHHCFLALLCLANDTMTT